MRVRNAGDPNYHERHGRRNALRAQSISTSITHTVSSILDVGCNRGYLGGAILNKFVGAECTGVDVICDAVDPALRANPRFSFIQSDVVQFHPTQRYDVVIYCAVHHHVFSNYGAEAALAVFARLINKCDRYFFFETGHLSEGSRWYWHGSISRHFSSDEDHIHWLVSSLGRRITDIDSVGAFWIHGTRRWLLRFSVEPLHNDLPKPSTITPQLLPSNHQQLDIRKTGGRTASFARIFKCSASTNTERTAEVFVKRWVDGTDAAFFEFNIGSSTDCKAAVKPIGMTATGELVFPYVHTSTALPNTSQIRTFFRCAAESRLESATLPKYLPSFATYRSIDVVDFNPSNMLVDASTGALRVVDFEYFSPTSTLRNKRNLGLLLFQSGDRVRGGITWSFAMLLMIARAAADSFRSPGVRIALKRPSLLGIAYGRFRDLLDRFLVFILPSVINRKQ